MAKLLYDEQNIKNTADAIREKSGDSDKKYKVADFAQAILDIPTGGGGSIDTVSVGVCVTETIKDYVTVKDPETSS